MSELKLRPPEPSTFSADGSHALPFKRGLRTERKRPASEGRRYTDWERTKLRLNVTGFRLGVVLVLDAAAFGRPGREVAKFHAVFPAQMEELIGIERERFFP